MTPAIPRPPRTIPDVDLDQVRTAADAATWLRHRAATHRADAASEPSPVNARALRNTGTTLDALAMAVAEFRGDVAAAAELARLAHDYHHPDQDTTEPLPADYRLACGHLAHSIAALAGRLTHVAAAKRHRQTQDPLARPDAERPLEL